MKSEKTYLKYDKFFQNEIISDIFHNVDNLEEIQVLFNFFKLDAKNYIEHRKNSNYSKYQMIAISFNGSLLICYYHTY